MEKIISKLENSFEKAVEDFEKTPLKTGLKYLVIIFILKKVWSWIKE